MTSEERLRVGVSTVLCASGQPILDQPVVPLLVDSISNDEH